jgi:hypothetical protein
VSAADRYRCAAYPDCVCDPIGVCPRALPEPMRWTKTPPSELGYWHRRQEAGASGEIIKLVKRDTGLTVRTFYGESWPLDEDVAFVEWAGPIAPPEEG